MSQGTASATVGTTKSAAAAKYAAAENAALLPRPASRRTRRTALGPPAAMAPDGADPAAHVTNARASGVRPTARTAASSASSSTNNRTAPNALALRTSRGKAA